MKSIGEDTAGFMTRVGAEGMQMLEAQPAWPMERSRARPGGAAAKPGAWAKDPRSRVRCRRREC